MTRTNLIKNRWWILQMGHYRDDIGWTCYIAVCDLPNAHSPCTFHPYCGSLKF